MITKLMTKAEYARHRDVSKAYISKLIKTGRIVLEYDEKIDPEKTDKLLGPIKNIKKPKSQTKKKAELPKVPDITNIPPADAEISFSEAQRRNEVYKAFLKKIEYEKEIGSLLPMGEIKQTAFDTGRELRDMLTSIPDRVAPLIPDMSDLHQRTQILKVEINSILENMANRLGET